MSKQRETTFDEVSRDLNQRVEGADKLRAEELDQLAATRRARGAAMNREQRRLAAKYPPDHPRLAAISNRLAVNANLTRDLDLEASRASADVPRMDAAGWVLHGHVRDKELKPVGGVTVALYDSRSKWVEGLGYACTGGDGYFRIETKDAAGAAAPLFLRVLSGEAAHLYADPAPLTPVGGGVEYRQIILGAGASACAPPFDKSNDPVPGRDSSRAGGAGAKAGGWSVRGRVTDAAGKGVAGVTVSLYDRDLIFDDRLGETETDDRGDYSFNYRTEDFRDLFEREPDLYLKVSSREGRTLHTSKQKIAYDAGRAEVIDVQIG